MLSKTSDCRRKYKRWQFPYFQWHLSLKSWGDFGGLYKQTTIYEDDANMTAWRTTWGIQVLWICYWCAGKQWGSTCQPQWIWMHQIQRIRTLGSSHRGGIRSNVVVAIAVTMLLPCCAVASSWSLLLTSSFGRCATRKSRGGCPAGTGGAQAARSPQDRWAPSYVPPFWLLCRAMGFGNWIIAILISAFQQAASLLPSM
jgi:hypothetical protein